MNELRVLGLSSSITAKNVKPTLLHIKLVRIFGKVS